MTNGERIRTMTDDDLACFLCSRVCDDLPHDATGDCIRGRYFDSCTDCLLDWLASETEGEYERVENY